MAVHDEAQAQVLAEERDAPQILELAKRINTLRGQIAGETNASRAAGLQAELSSAIQQYNQLASVEEGHRE